MSVRRLAVIPLAIVLSAGAVALAGPAVAAAAQVPAAASASQPPASREVLRWLGAVARMTDRLAASRHVRVTSVAQQGRCAVKASGRWLCEAARGDAGLKDVRCALKVMYRTRAGRPYHARGSGTCAIGPGRARPPAAGTALEALAAFVPADPFSLTSNVRHPDRAATASACVPAVRRGHALFACVYRVSAAQVVNKVATFESCVQAGTVRWVNGMPAVRRGPGACSVSARSPGQGG